LTHHARQNYDDALAPFKVEYDGINEDIELIKELLSMIGKPSPLALNAKMLSIFGYTRSSLLLSNREDRYDHKQPEMRCPGGGQRPSTRRLAAGRSDTLQRRPAL
jgi:hypothetical protein